jgi:hypothetical protein
MEDNKVSIIENLINYKYNFSTRNIIINKCYDNTDENFKKDKSYYFILDSGSNDIYYFVYESFIFIKLLIELNKENNIKILTKKDNNEILKVLLNLFNIQNEVINIIDNYNNITYSPSIYSIYYHHRKLINNNYFNNHLNYYITHIKNNLDNDIKNTNKNVLINNDNDNNNNNNNNNDNDNFDGIIIQNDIKNIKDNFSIINKADNIYLYYNSSFYFNCIFLKNKNLFIIENNIYKPNGLYSHIAGIPFLEYLFDIIANNNKLNFVKK